jgi:SAM-dependent methyltransferase
MEVAVQELNPTERFSDRVADYVRYRPSYPSALFDDLEARLGGLKGLSVADVGAGTGIFTRLLLNRGAQVSAVEPNAKMRASLMQALGGRTAFRCSRGTAENTGLAERSFQLVTCAQAFHWFDALKARSEFNRILAAAGRVALIWNDTDQSTAFGQAYEKFKCKFGGEAYQQVAHQTERVDIALQVFFRRSGCATKIFPNFQELDEQGLIGRFFSSSYSPAADDSLKIEATAELRDLFATHQQRSLVRFDYRTELFFGA